MKPDTNARNCTTMSIETRMAPTDPALAKRLGRMWSLTVTGAWDVAPRMRRVQLTGPELAEFDPRPGQEIILLLPQQTDEPIRRHYTIRRFDAAQSLLDVDFVMHGDSPAVRWASSAKKGDPLAVMGPRGRITVVPDAEWHLFSGDDTALPAIFAMVQALPATAKAFVFIEVGDEGDRQELVSNADVTLEWLYRRGARSDESTLLIERVAAFPLPPEQGHVYLLGETRKVRTERQELIARGLDRNRISAEGYWRPGRVGGHDHILDPGMERGRPGQS
jgi:NADPH-dependent ferric siderophore reductase